MALVIFYVQTKYSAFDGAFRYNYLSAFISAMQNRLQNYFLGYRESES